MSNLNFVRVGSKDIEVARIRGRVDYFGGRLELQEESDEPRKLEIDDIPTLQVKKRNTSSVFNSFLARFKYLLEWARHYLHKRYKAYRSQVKANRNGHASGVYR